MIFEYNLQTLYTKEIVVDDIGNTALRCTTEKDYEYYIMTRTVMGKTAILKLGPVIPDLDELISNYSLYFKKINYKEALINKEINLFINDPKKEILEVKEISLDEFKSAIPPLDPLFLDNDFIAETGV